MTKFQATLASVAALFVVQFAHAAPPAESPAAQQALSYHGSAEMTDIKSGKITETLRLGDRSQPPSAYKVGMTVSLVNGDKTQDARSFDDQIKADAYGKVKFTAVHVTQFSSLSAADQKAVLQFYTQKQITAAKGVISELFFSFVP